MCLLLLSQRCLGSVCKMVQEGNLRFSNSCLGSIHTKRKRKQNRTKNDQKRSNNKRQTSNKFFAFSFAQCERAFWLFKLLSGDDTNYPNGTKDKIHVFTVDIITARVRSTREGNVLTRVCPSIHPQICLSTGGAVRSSRGGGEGQVQLAGGSGPGRGGVRSRRGGQVQLGGGAGGVSQDRTTEWVLTTTRRAVCLLRSRRRTFLFLNNLENEITLP